MWWLVSSALNYTNYELENSYRKMWKLSIIMGAKFLNKCSN